MISSYYYSSILLGGWIDMYSKQTVYYYIIMTLHDISNAK